jgi:hypothetical protein
MPEERFQRFIGDCQLNCDIIQSDGEIALMLRCVFSDIAITRIIVAQIKQVKLAFLINGENDRILKDGAEVKKETKMPLAQGKVVFSIQA